MGDCNHRAHERALTAKDHVTVAFHKVARDGENSGDECGDDERAEERTHLQSHVWCDREDDAEERKEARGSQNSQEGSEKKTLCPPSCCVTGEPAAGGGVATEGRRWHKLILKLESSQMSRVLMNLVKGGKGIK